MKKLILISLLSLFSFQFAQASADENTFIAEPAIQPSSTLFSAPLTEEPALENPVPPAGIMTVAPTAQVPLATPVTAASPRNLIYENAFVVIGSEFSDYLKVKANDDFAALEPSQQRDCDRRYNTILNDRKIDIRIALGYFDWSAGTDIITQGLNFGGSPSADLGGFKAMQRMLTTPCQGNLQACGFDRDTQTYALFTKTVVIRGQSYAVEVRVSQPSLTEFYKDNISRKEEQDTKSLQTKQFYMQALQDADMAIYIGHSRNGGGPDFNPPILKADGHADYDGYYIPNKIGVKMIVEALTKTSRQAPIVALFSCDSREHFLNRLQPVAPKTGFITSTRVDTINNLFAASFGSIDAVLRGQCQKSFYQSLRADPDVKDLVTMDNMFN